MRNVVLTTVAFLWCAVLFAICAPLAVLWPTLQWRNRLSLWAGHAWARFSLWISGISVEIEGAEHFACRPAIFTFNHTNVLDFFANAFFAHRRCLVFGKRELIRVPLLGWGWWLGGHPMLYRDDPRRWQRQMDRVEALLGAGYSTIIAPEGKRSRDGALLPFKKGAFRLAVATRLPVVPVVIHGAREALRGGVPRSGTTLRIVALPPVATEGWSLETLDEHVAQLRSLYLEALAPTPAAAG